MLCESRFVKCLWVVYAILLLMVAFVFDIACLTGLTEGILSIGLIVKLVLTPILFTGLAVFTQRTLVGTINFSSLSFIGFVYLCSNTSAFLGRAFLYNKDVEAGGIMAILLGMLSIILALSPLLIPTRIINSGPSH